jgi:hypothetical protein
MWKTYIRRALTIPRYIIYIYITIFLHSGMIVYDKQMFCPLFRGCVLNPCHRNHFIAYNELLPIKFCHILTTFIAHFCPWLDGSIWKTFFYVNQILQSSLQRLYQETSVMLTSKDGLIFVVNPSTMKVFAVFSNFWSVSNVLIQLWKIYSLVAMQLILLCWDESLYKYDVQITERILKLGHKMTY